MGKSWKRSQREAMGKGSPITEREFDLMTVLADIVEATPRGQRTPAMSALLSDVRAAQAEYPKPNGGNE